MDNFPGPGRAGREETLMAFCKELKAANPGKIYPRPSLATPGENEKTRRDWWETGVDDRLETMASSIRWMKFIVIILIVVQVLR
jgi:hypothetical protein